MKRFYEQVAVTTPDDGSGFEVRLDGRPVRTPLRNVLNVPTNSLAEAVAGEWRSQREEIDVAGMPMTRIAATALDRVAANRDAYVDQVAGYAETDLVCYRAPGPTTLVARQSRAWEPLLAWVRDTFDAELAATDGLLPVEQDPGAIEKLRGAVANHDDFELAALGVAVAASGSVVVALALSNGHLSAGDAFEVSQLDESFQTEIWGADEEAEARRSVLRGEINVAAAFLELLRAV
jgi:chaperone required for assembly of F1-ATPase